MFNSSTSKLIFEKYYKSETTSNVTSSHWKTIGGHSVSQLPDGRIKLNGWGFGSYRSNNLKNRIKYILESCLNRWLLLKYRARKSSIESAKLVAKKTNRYFDFDCVKQALSLDFITEKISLHDIQTVCVIGDGYGFFGALLKLQYPHLKILSVNLGKTLFFDAHYTKLVNPEFQLKFALEDEETEPDFYFLPAEDYKEICRFKVDLFINIASMQEMDNAVIENYFKLIKENKSNQTYFYCCNRVEKKLPDGEITRIQSYPWDGFQIIHNTECPWYQRYPAHIPPFWRPFDGRIDHIFAKVIPAKNESAL